MDRSSDSVTPVGGTEPVPAVHDDPISEPVTVEGRWPDDPKADWPDDQEVHKQVLTGLAELLGGRDPRNMSVKQIQDALKVRFPRLEAKIVEAEAWDALHPDEDYGTDPEAGIEAGGSIFYESGEEFLASFFLQYPDILDGPGPAAA